MSVEAEINPVLAEEIDEVELQQENRQKSEAELQKLVVKEKEVVSNNN